MHAVRPGSSPQIESLPSARLPRRPGGIFVAALAAFAIALLGLHPISARAGAPVFDPFLTSVAPFNAPVAESSIAPVLSDLDRDGDLDLVVGKEDDFLYFENTGNASVPVFVQRLAGNPFNGLVIESAYVAPALVDFDRDGLIDVISAMFPGQFSNVYRNVGSPTLPAFELVPAPAGLTPVGFDPTVSSGDLDGDGDADLIVGEQYGILNYFENIGTATAATYAQRTGSANPLASFSNPGADDCVAPALGDLDGDGDLDAVIGRFGSGLRYLENRGTATAPQFHELVEKANPFHGETTSGCSRIGIGDLDADGDADVVVGDSFGDRLRAFENKTGQFVTSNDIDPNPFGWPNNAVIPGADLDGDGDVSIFSTSCDHADNIGSVTNPQFWGAALPGLTGCSSLPTSIDLDGDGDLDIVSQGVLYTNFGTPNSPAFVPGQALFPADPFLPVTIVSFGDLDGDDDQDAAVVYTDPTFGGFNTAESHYFENVGSATAPSFVERTGAANRLSFARPGFVVRLADYDGDGDADALEAPYSANLVQQTLYWENVGASTSLFVSRPTSSRRNPFSRFLAEQAGLGPATLPFLLADMDGDGDADGFAVRVEQPTIPSELVGRFLENSLVRPAPRFQRLNGEPFRNLSSIGLNASPAAADLDADGDPDFVVAEGGEPNFLNYVENTGNARTHRLVVRTGAANPFAGIVGPGLGEPRIALGDLDGDADFDLISAEGPAPMRFFENVGTVRQPAFLERVVEENPVDSIVLGPLNAPALGDLDGDGDLDLVAGEGDGTGGAGFRYFENGGNAEWPGFIERTGATNPFNGLTTTGVWPISTLADVDRDGDLDLVAAEFEASSLSYFENTGTVHSPSFVRRIGVTDPFDGVLTDSIKGPVLVDLDADGAPDLVYGKDDGLFDAVYTVPEPSRGLLLSAGIVLLAGLRRGGMSARRVDPHVESLTKAQ